MLDQASPWRFALFLSPSPRFVFELITALKCLEERSWLHSIGVSHIHQDFLSEISFCGFLWYIQHPLEIRLVYVGPLSAAHAHFLSFWSILDLLSYHNELKFYLIHAMLELVVMEFRRPAVSLPIRSSEM